MYKKFLVRCNSTTGKAGWWMVFAAGMLICLAWVASALPYLVTIFDCWKGVGAFVNLPEGGTGLLCYGRWVLRDPMVSNYILGIILSTVIARIGWLMVELGLNYGRGLRYYPPVKGQPMGFWIK